MSLKILTIYKTLNIVQRKNKRLKNEKELKNKLEKIVKNLV